MTNIDSDQIIVLTGTLLQKLQIICQYNVKYFATLVSIKVETW